MSEEHRLESHLFDNTRFAGCDLADDRNKDRSTLARDRGHLHRHIEVFQRHMAVAFAKRPFRLEPLAIDQALDHDLGVSRDMKVNCRCLDDANGTAGKPSSHGHLILVDRKLLWSGKQNDGRAADDNRTWHRFFSFLIFSPMQVAARSTRPRRHAYAKTVLGLQGTSVGAHVLHAIFRIARDAERRGEIGSGIEPWRRYRNWQAGKAFARSQQI